MCKFKFILRKCFLLSSVFGLLIQGCASNTVTTQIDKNKHRVVVIPKEFQSPVQAINTLLDTTDSKSSNDNRVRAIKERSLKTLLSQQTAIANELNETGQLLLRPGISYAFDLESFCVHAGEERPLKGDGLYLGNIEGGAKSWLPIILRDYQRKGLTQEKAQVLIWSLLSGSRFDELSSENQIDILKLFPDAPVRFGNSIVQSYATNYLLSQVPTELLSAKDNYDKYKSILQNTRRQFSEIERVLSPESSRVTPLEVGWLKHEDGYYIHLRAHGYKKVSVQIYAPKDIKPGTYFNPTQHVALPGIGQRLALGSKMIDQFNNRADRFLKNNAGVSTAEALFIMKHPLDAVKIYNAAQSALEATWKNMNSSQHFEDDKADAFRHFVWSAKITREIGEEKAKEYLDAHEDYVGNKPEAKKMDLYNNEKGMAYGSEYRGSKFEQDVIEAGQNKLQNGELTWVK